jgi:YHS domain-containing protein
MALACGTTAPQHLEAAPVVVNPNTGLAISGVDPVAYFIDGKPVFGKPEFEMTYDGTVWRFENEGNRAAFKADPDVYMPRFGGYDPMAIAQGKWVAGYPMIWAVVGERLYLFYDEAGRAAFLADAGRIIETATRKWPEVARTMGQ